MAGRLVILGSSNTALAVARDAVAHGLEPWVVDSDSGAAFLSRHVQGRRLASRDPQEALEAVRRLAGADTFLIATGDRWVRFVAAHAAVLQGLFARVLHARADALDICLSKARFTDFCKRHDLSVPRSWLVDTEPRPDGLRFPLLLRPAETLHDRADLGLPKAIELHDEATLQSWLQKFAAARCSALVAESLLGHRLVQYSVPYARWGDRMLSFVAYKVRPLPERCDVGTCVAMRPAPDVEALARRAVEALDLLGIGEVEILQSLDTGENFLIEINPRPWLQYALAPASGHDFLGLVLGDAYARPGRAAKQGKVWIDFREDLFACFSRSEGAVRAGKIPLGDYLKSIARANVFARFAPGDPKPAFGDAPAAFRKTPTA